MEQQYSKAALVRFLETVGKQGLVNANTVGGWRAACARILEDVEDGDDVRGIDASVAIKRYNNRHPGDLAPSSLREYERRLGLVVKEFTSYIDDPAAYRPRGRTPTTVNGERTMPRRRGKQTELEMPERAAEAPPPAPAPRPPATAVLALEFPMRADFLAQVVVPRDMKLAEAKRFGSFILTLAQDYQPPEG